MRTRTLLALLLAVACGCGKSAEEKAERKIEKQIEKASGGKAHVDLSEGKMTVKTKEGSQEVQFSGGKDLKVPGDFPKDVYLYKNAALTSSVKTEKSFQLIFSTKDAPETIQQAYQKEMPASGWKETATMNMGAMTMLHYEKGKAKAMVHISREKEETTLTVIVELEQ